MARLMRYRGAIRKTVKAIQMAEPVLVACDRYMVVMVISFSAGLIIGLSHEKGFF